MLLVVDLSYYEALLPASLEEEQVILYGYKSNTIRGTDHNEVLPALSWNGSQTSYNPICILE